MKHARRLLAGLLGVGLAGSLLVACHNTTQFFVSTSGSGSACTEASPCSLATGLGLADSGGEQLLLKRGETYTTSLNISDSGSDNEHLLVVQAYGSGALPVVTGTSSSYCVDVSGDWVLVAYLNLTNCRAATGPGNTYEGGYISRGAHNWLTHSTVSLNNVGAKSHNDATDTVIQESTFVDNNKYEDCSSQGQAIDIEGDGTIVQGNTVYGSRFFDCGEWHGTAIEVYGGSDSVIQRNVLAQSDSCMEIGGTTSGQVADNTLAIYNVCTNNFETGDDVESGRCFIVHGHLTAGGAGPYPSTGTKLFNNSCHLRDAAPVAGTTLKGLVCDGGCSTAGHATLVLKVQNNIFSVDASSGERIGCSETGNATEFVSDHNMYSGGSDACDNGTGDVTSGSPGFVNATTVPYNLRLLNGSTNEAAGVSKGYTLDLDGATVPQPVGTNPDRGCYERV